MEDENAFTPTCCASRKFQVIDVRNTRDKILSDERRSKCE